MKHVLLRSWWMLALRGSIALLFGVLALAWPGLTLLGLVALFAAYALMAGVVTVVGAVKGRKDDDRWWVAFLLGLVSVSAGAIAIAFPDLTMLALVLLFGVNALITGILDVVLAVRLRKRIQGEWLLIVTGIVSILFGLLLLLFPTGAGAMALVWLISFYAMIIGILFLVVAFRVRAWTRHAGTNDRASAGSL